MGLFEQKPLRNCRAGSLFPDVCRYIPITRNVKRVCFGIEISGPIPAIHAGIASKFEQIILGFSIEALSSVGWLNFVSFHCFSTFSKLFMTFFRPSRLGGWYFTRYHLGGLKSGKGKNSLLFRALVRFVPTLDIFASSRRCCACFALVRPAFPRCAGSVRLSRFRRVASAWRSVDCFCLR